MATILGIFRQSYEYTKIYAFTDVNPEDNIFISP